MKTVFKVGMKVYDQFIFPNKEGRVLKIVEADDYPIKVTFGNPGITWGYTKDGIYGSNVEPSLSTSPYSIVGFEQKAPVPTFEEAWTKTDRIYEPKSEYNKKEFGGYPSQGLANAAEALRRLLFLRDYYNEGWLPDWNNRQRDKFCIMVDKNMLCKESFQSNNKPLAFKSREILDRFFEEQKKLLEIAKPLL